MMYVSMGLKKKNSNSLSKSLLFFWGFVVPWLRLMALNSIGSDLLRKQEKGNDLVVKKDGSLVFVLKNFFCSLKCLDL